MERIAFIGDWHIPFHVKCLEDVIQDVNKYASTVVLMGDIVDFYQISHYRRDPARLVHLGEDVAMAVEMLSKIRKKNKIFLIGNHELRLARYIADHAPELHSLGAVNLEELLKLNKLGYSVERKITIKAAGREWLVFHGDHFGKNAGLKNIETYMANGITGHSHKLSVTCKKVADATFTWVETGCLEQQVEHFDSFATYSDFGKMHDWHHGYILMDDRGITVVNNVCG